MKGKGESVAADPGTSNPNSFKMWSGRIKKTGVGAKVDSDLFYSSVTHPHEDAVQPFFLRVPVFDLSRVKLSSPSHSHGFRHPLFLLGRVVILGQYEDRSDGKL